MENRIFLMGQTHDIFTAYCEASIFAFPSAYEGFGLALVEAMSSGLPCIGYSAAAGVNEIIEDGKNGILVNDGVDSLAKGMSILIQNNEMRYKMGKNAHICAKAYSPEKIWEIWDKVLQENLHND